MAETNSAGPVRTFLANLGQRFFGGGAPTATEQVQVQTIAVKGPAISPSSRSPGFDVAMDPRINPEARAAVRDRQKDVEPTPDRAPIAPWPSIDRYPIILGSNVTLAYISSIFRLCLVGYRREYVDLLDELLERDPHTYAVCAQRVHAVSGGRIQVVAAEVDEEETEDGKRAEELRQYVEERVEAIPDLRQSLTYLQWGGLFYGVGAAEISWRADERGLYPARLHWIHSRRLNYPDPGSFSVRVWDQGMVSSWDIMSDPTGHLFGVSCEDFPGKFIVHTPSVRGNYPTRDGLGRQVAYWSALKLMGARGASQYIERFGKPWVAGYYATAEKQEEHRSADDDDIAKLDAAGLALGIGGLANATLPDSTRLELFGPSANAPPRQLLHVQFCNFCNNEISKAVLGQGDTTDPNPNGARASTEVRKEGTQELYRYDSTCLGDTLRHDLFRWIVRGRTDYDSKRDDKLIPKALIHAAEEPDLDAALQRAIEMANAGAPVDADKTAEETGVFLLPDPNKEGGKGRRSKAKDAKTGEDYKGRRLYPIAPMKPYEIQSLHRLENGEELEPPDKAILPSAQSESGGADGGAGGGGAGGGSAQGVSGAGGSKTAPAGTSKATPAAKPAAKPSKTKPNDKASDDS